MDVMNLPAKLLEQIKRDYPTIHFKPGDEFRWSAEQQTIFYTSSTEEPVWTLLHELGHMIRQHNSYRSDTALVQMEVEAWTTAQGLADNYGIIIDEDYVQDCIDSYRQWRHERSTCPTCQQTGLETSTGQYHCVNCADTWQVTPSRFCRVYRKQLRT